MDDLIEALTIFRKYANPKLPTHCEHDILYVCIPKSEITDPVDIERLKQLGFDAITDSEYWTSYKFGSA